MRVACRLLRCADSASSIAATRAQGLPSLSLQGSLGHIGLSPELGSDYRADNIGLYVDWPLFTGGMLCSRVRAASARQRGAEAGYDGAQREVERESRLACRGVVSGIHKIRANRLAVQANRTALEASRNGVEVGTRTEFDLLNAQNIIQIPDLKTHSAASRRWRYRPAGRALGGLDPATTGGDHDTSRQRSIFTPTTACCR